MDDMQIRTVIRQSQANGLYQQMQDIKRERENLKLKHDRLEDKLIDEIKKNGNVIAFKDDTPHVLTVGLRTSTKLDKSEVAEAIGVSQKELNALGIARLVEEGTLSSSTLENAMHTETEEKLKARKAKKTDLELIGR